MAVDWVITDKNLDNDNNNNNNTVEPRELELWRETKNSSSYRDRLNAKFAILIIDSYWLFSPSVYGTMQIF